MNTVSESFGWFISFEDCWFFLPFICRNCGNCCKSPPPSAVICGLYSIAEHLGIPLRQILDDRFAGIAEWSIEDGREMAQLLPAWETSACPFLTVERKCEVYQVRPKGCRLFPIETDGGACGTDCPGDREFKRAWRVLSKDMIAYGSYDAPRAKRNPNADEWCMIVERLKSSNPSSAMLKRFFELNDVPTNLVG